MPRPALLALLLFVAALRALGADPVLRVVTPEQTLAFTAAEFAALPRTELTAVEPHGKQSHRYAGVTVRELLTRAGAPLGEKLRGPALALGVLVRSADNYTVLFALAEFDAAFSTRTLLLVDREDGAPPPASAAPFRLVVPGDTRGARWARLVTSIEVVQLAPKS